MFGFQKRLEKLKSAADGYANQSCESDSVTPTTPELSSSKARRASLPDVTYPLILRPILKSSTTPTQVHEFVLTCFRDNYELVPKRTKLVDDVHFFNHQTGCFVILMFTSKLVAELFVGIASAVISACPFVPSGSQLSLQVNPNCRTFDKIRLRDDKGVYLQGVAGSWTDAQRLKQYLETVVLNGVESEFGIDLVKQVQLLPGAAYIGFRRKAVVDILFYRCEKDKQLLCAVSEDAVLVRYIGKRKGARVEAGQAKPPLKTTSTGGEQEKRSPSKQEGKAEAKEVQRTSSNLLGGRRSGDGADIPTVKDQGRGLPSEAVQSKATKPVGEADVPTVKEPNRSASEAIRSTRQEHASQVASAVVEEPLKAMVKEAECLNTRTSDCEVTVRRENHLNSTAADGAEAEHESRVKRSPGEKPTVNESGSSTTVPRDNKVTTSDCSEAETVCNRVRAKDTVTVNKSDILSTARNRCVTTCNDSTVECSEVEQEHIRDRVTHAATNSHSEARGSCLTTTKRTEAEAEQEQRAGKRARLKGCFKTAAKEHCEATSTASTVEQEERRESVQEKPVDRSPGAREERTKSRRTHWDQQAQKTLPVWQSSIFLSAFDVHNFCPQKLQSFFQKILSKERPSQEVSVLVLWQAPLPEAQVLLSSEEIADALMDVYISETERFCMQLSRHKYYVRPGAVYSQASTAAIVRDIVLHGLAGARLYPEQLEGAVSEALERTLLTQGVLRRCQRLVKGMIFVPGSNIAVIAVEEPVAIKLLSVSPTLKLAGLIVQVTLAAAGFQYYNQVSLHFPFMPTSTAQYDVNGFKALIRRLLKKVRPDEPVSDCITEIRWIVGHWKAEVIFQTEAAADTLMDAFLQFTPEFQLGGAPIAVYRDKSYMRPGICYRNTAQISGTEQLLFLGIDQSLDPRQVKAALQELLSRALAGAGVIDHQLGLLKSVFFRTGETRAYVTVDDIVAWQLQNCWSPLMLAGNVLTVLRYPSLPAPPAQELVAPPPPPPPPLAHSEYESIESRAPCGGWIEPEVEEGEISYLEHCISATLSTL